MIKYKINWSELGPDGAQYALQALVRYLNAEAYSSRDTMLSLLCIEEVSDDETNTDEH